MWTFLVEKEVILVDLLAKKRYLRGLFPQNEVVATHIVLLLTNCVFSFSVGPALFVGKNKHCITQEVVAGGVFVTKLKKRFPSVVFVIFLQVTVC